MNDELKKLPVKGGGEPRVPTENDVVHNGVIVGTDPDPNIRAALLREAVSGDSTNTA